MDKKRLLISNIIALALYFTIDYTLYYNSFGWQSVKKGIGLLIIFNIIDWVYRKREQ